MTVDTSSSPSSTGPTSATPKTSPSPTKQVSDPIYSPANTFSAYFKKRSESIDIIKQSAEDLRQSACAKEVTELTLDQIQAKADLAALEILGSKKGTVAKAMNAGQARYTTLMASYRPSAGA